jgi:predicted O-methyltransferase YrrM
LTDGGTAIPEVHRLLQVLGAGRDVLELGSAFGVGAAAMAETARSVVTVERDPERAALARARLARHANVEPLEGDAYELLRERGPFGLVFADGGPYDWEIVVSLVARGGFVVKDDLTPARGVDGDPVREFLLRDSRLAATEILVSPAMAAIVAVRVA